MSQICECCGQRLPDVDPVARLRRLALERGFYVSPADEVRTDGAAWLLGVQPATLRQDRCYFGRIPCRRVGGRVAYALADLAKCLFPSMPLPADDAEDGGRHAGLFSGRGELMAVQRRRLDRITLAIEAALVLAVVVGIVASLLLT